MGQWHTVGQDEERGGRRQAYEVIKCNSDEVINCHSDEVINCHSDEGN